MSSLESLFRLAMPLEFGLPLTNYFIAFFPFAENRHHKFIRWKQRKYYSLAMTFHSPFKLYVWPLRWNFFCWTVSKQNAVKRSVMAGIQLVNWISVWRSFKILFVFIEVKELWGLFDGPENSSMWSYIDGNNRLRIMIFRLLQSSIQVFFISFFALKYWIRNLH